MKESNSKSSPMLAAIVTGAALVLLGIVGLSNDSILIEADAALDGALRGAPWAAPVFCLIALTALLRARVRVSSRTIISEVPGYAGRCAALWVSPKAFDPEAPRLYVGLFRPAQRLWGSPIVWLQGGEFFGVLHGDFVISTADALGQCKSFRRRQAQST
jgi:hypothetical protein